MIRRFFGAAIFLAGTVNSLAAMAQPAERPAMIRLVAAAETVSDSRCTGAVFVINDSSEAACAMSVLGESGGLAGFRLPAGLARGLGDALAQSQRPRPEALAQRAGGPALPACLPAPRPRRRPRDRTWNPIPTDKARITEPTNYRAAARRPVAPCASRSRIAVPSASCGPPRVAAPARAG